MDYYINFNVAMVIAVFLGECVSYMWYANSWGRKLGERYLVTALVCDVGLVIFLKYVIDRHWSVSNWEEGVILALWLALFAACLEAPHIVHNTRALSHCFAHVAHKFTLVLVMILVLVYFRHY